MTRWFTLAAAVTLLGCSEIEVPVPVPTELLASATVSSPTFSAGIALKVTIVVTNIGTQSKSFLAPHCLSPFIAKDRHDKVVSPTDGLGPCDWESETIIVLAPGETYTTTSDWNAPQAPGSYVLTARLWITNTYQSEKVPTTSTVFKVSA